MSPSTHIRTHVLRRNMRRCWVFVHALLLTLILPFPLSLFYSYILSQYPSNNSALKHTRRTSTPHTARIYYVYTHADAHTLYTNNFTTQHCTTLHYITLRYDTIHNATLHLTHTLTSSLLNASPVSSWVASRPVLKILSPSLLSKGLLRLRYRTLHEKNYRKCSHIWTGVHLLQSRWCTAETITICQQCGKISERVSDCHNIEYKHIVRWNEWAVAWVCTSKQSCNYERNGIILPNNCGSRER